MQSGQLGMLLCSSTLQVVGNGCGLLVTRQESEILTADLLNFAAPTTPLLPVSRCVCGCLSEMRSVSLWRRAHAHAVQQEALST